MKNLLLMLSALCLTGTLAIAQLNVNYTISPQADRKPISPLIYGSNWEETANPSTDENYTFVRMGGNRATGYNWENNASNAGEDYFHVNDNFWPWYLDITDSEEPGIVVTTIADQAKANGAEALITLQMAGYVSADKDGEVETTAPSPRWYEGVFEKGSAFSLTPDKTDDKVYIDEFVNFLTDKYGSGGLKYSLDNEPDLWNSTHPYIYPTQPTIADLIDRSTALATAVKNVDPQAEIFGLVSYGFNGYLSFQNAPDWPALEDDYSWFIDYYLEAMNDASTAANQRLVDVIDLHWYPEATGDQRIINPSANSTADKLARLQAPRAFWDPDYTENSWIFQYFDSFMPLIPTVQNSIDTYYPGTKLSFNEFQFGGYEDITGTIALTDVLGIFGKYDVYAATHWSDPGSFGALAYKLYNNYDGNDATFGETYVDAAMDDKINSSIYASVSGESDEELHVIVLNKSMTSSISGSFDISGSSVNYTTATIYGVEEGTAAIIQKTDLNVSGNEFSYSLPPLSVYHFILTSDGSSVPVASVSVSPETATIGIGGSVELTAEVSPADASNKSVTWSSTDESIAAVNSAGLVSAVAEGSAYIIATTVDGNFQDSSYVTVTNETIPVTGVSITIASTSIEVGGSTQATATVSPADATDTSVTWSSSDESIATVSPNGLITGIAEGSAIITVTTTDGGFTDQEAISVTEGSSDFCTDPTSISLPFSKDGTGEFCFVTTEPAAYINSWGLELLEINGVDYTNVWSNSLPSAQNGEWSIHYIGNFSWSHFEIVGSAQSIAARTNNDKRLTPIDETDQIEIFPNPIKDQHMWLKFKDQSNNSIVISLYNSAGIQVYQKELSTQHADEQMYKITVGNLPVGLYTINIETDQNLYVKKLLIE
ncbi:glycoside hydrolase family 44 protein [Fulvivirga sediminis]|uniref:Ig-like domain-containing protein n=1 Tax=Fulvivirga sediminis TaxID=2803949 RepID=A0A937FDI5_9BACT|nr:glycoside hydrolase family 44 protein [Fulvivirga sediminis]MBL3658428.1 Ig-like domain-containing protein [Fulvivirga sediminis]